MAVDDYIDWKTNNLVGDDKFLGFALISLLHFVLMRFATTLTSCTAGC
jgi:hypothetical protein